MSSGQMQTSRRRVYATLLRAPHVGNQALLGLFAQLTQGAAPLGLVLVVRQATGSLITAGAVSAALWVGAAVARPIQGRLIDWRGTRLVMLICGPAHTAALVGVVVVARAGGAAWAMILCSAVAGLMLPPVSVAMRVEWGRHVPANELTAAFSLVFLTQEIALVTGPLLIAALVAFGVGFALITAATISGVATIGFAALGTTESTARDDVEVALRPRRTTVPVVLAVAFLLGSTLGVFQVASPSLAIARGVPALGGILIAAVSVGGITGALLYGGVRRAAAGCRRLAPGDRRSRAQPRIRDDVAADRSPWWIPRRGGVRMDVDRGRRRHRCGQRGRRCPRAAQRLSAGVLRGDCCGLRGAGYRRFRRVAFSVAELSSIRTADARRRALPNDHPNPSGRISISGVDNANDDDIVESGFPERKGSVDVVSWRVTEEIEYRLLFGRLSPTWGISSWGLVTVSRGDVVGQVTYDNRPRVFTRDGLIAWLMGSGVDAGAASQLADLAVEARGDLFPDEQSGEDDLWSGQEAGPDIA